MFSIHEVQAYKTRRHRCKLIWSGINFWPSKFPPPSIISHLLMLTLIPSNMHEARPLSEWQIILYSLSCCTGKERCWVFDGYQWHNTMPNCKSSTWLSIAHLKPSVTTPSSPETQIGFFEGLGWRTPPPIVDPPYPWARHTDFHISEYQVWGWRASENLLDAARRNFQVVLVTSGHIWKVLWVPPAAGLIIHGISYPWGFWNGCLTYTKGPLYSICTHGQEIDSPTIQLIATPLTDFFWSFLSCLCTGLYRWLPVRRCTVGFFLAGVVYFNSDVCTLASMEE